MLQQTKRGFRTVTNFIAVAYLRIAKLKHLPPNPLRAALLHKSSLTGTFPFPHEFTRYGRTEGAPARSCN